MTAMKHIWMLHHILSQGPTKGSDKNTNELCCSRMLFGHEMSVETNPFENNF